MTSDRQQHAHRQMDIAFGIGREAAQQALRTNAEAKRIYDCAIQVIAGEQPSQIDILRAELEKPIELDGEDRQWSRASGDVFDPWNVFPEVYGSYSSDFDDMAILTLDNILNGRCGASAGEGLAHEMFREMLCTAGLCDYGTSPRGCFPTYRPDGTATSDLMAALLEKWREYRRVEWED